MTTPNPPSPHEPQQPYEGHQPQQPYEPHQPYGPYEHGQFGPYEPGPSEQQQVREPLWWTARRKAVALTAGMLLAVGAGGAGAMAAVALTNDEPAVTSPAGVTPVSAAKGTVAQIAAAVQPSVVSVQTITRNGQGEGSGVILRPDGTILTNAHVVDGADQVRVKFSSGKTAPARVLGADTGTDIAVIKAQGVSGLKPAALGDSSALAVGDPVLAMGSPLGLDGSVTSGIVSALGRTLQEGNSQDNGQQGLPPGLGRQAQQQPSPTIKNAIQTDAAINPGNSGGALVNGAGQVVGINTAIATAGGSGNIGVGFAIPINNAKQIADKLAAS